MFFNPQLISFYLHWLLSHFEVILALKLDQALFLYKLFKMIAYHFCHEKVVISRKISYTYNTIQPKISSFIHGTQCKSVVGLMNIHTRPESCVNFKVQRERERDVYECIFYDIITVNNVNKFNVVWELVS